MICPNCNRQNGVRLVITYLKGNMMGWRGKMIDKTKKIDWFNEIMKSKMLKHNENPIILSYDDLIKRLDEEVEELKKAVRNEPIESAILECGDVSNFAYFIACKLKLDIKRDSY